MRLLHTETLTLHEFYGDLTPHYGILSHTWGDDELTYQDLLNPSEVAKTKKGYAKMSGFVKKCRELKLDYCWIDTCCIDKSSSAELSEAINSMYQWYKNSHVCLVYFADIEIPPDNENVKNIDMDFRRIEMSLQNIETSEESENRNNDKSVLEKLLLACKLNRDRAKERQIQEPLRRSRWFTRGWTLQELIAPQDVKFYDQFWDSIDVSSATLSSITNIPIEVLEGGITDGISIAQKMCWASSRQTTRVEDIAYSLLGIFGVNMPLLYGEGDNAFLRLQEEIIRRSDDETIFLWADDSSDDHSLRSVFARHPSEFARCRTAVRMEDVGTQPLPYTLTNTGLHMTLRLLPSEPSRPKASVRLWPLQIGQEGVDEGLYMPVLHCQDSLTGKMQSIYLKRLRPGGQQFARVKTHTTISASLGPNVSKLPPDQVYIRQTIRSLDLSPTQPIFGFQLLDFDPSRFLRHDIFSGASITKHRERASCNGLSIWEGNLLRPIPDMDPPRAVTAVPIRAAALLGDLYLVVGLLPRDSPRRHQEGMIWYKAFTRDHGSEDFDPPTLGYVKMAYALFLRQDWGSGTLRGSHIAIYQDHVVARASLSVETIKELRVIWDQKPERPRGNTNRRMDY